MLNGNRIISSTGKVPSILYLAVGVFDKGGISRYCRYQIRAIREIIGAANVRVLSFFAPGRNDFEDPFEVDWHARGPGLLSDLAVLLRSAREMIRWRPDVVWPTHVHLLPTALAVRSLAGGAPVIVNAYGRELWGAHQWLHRRTARRADLVVSDCYATADFLANQYGVSRERISVVWDCVDTKRFQPLPRNHELMQTYGIPDGDRRRYVLTLGRLERRARYKGYDRLLEAMAAMREHGRIVALFAGDGDDRERLQARAGALGIVDRVRFLGSVPEAQLPDVYNLCDLFTLVSECGPGCGEGTPHCLLEAAACGKPTVVGNEDGSREAVIDGLSGWAISPRDPGALRSVLVRALFDDELREQMGRRARRRIEEEFSYEGFRAKHARILEDLLASPDSGHKP